jgi:hypothetical protein
MKFVSLFELSDNTMWDFCFSVSVFEHNNVHCLVLVGCTMEQMRVVKTGL